MHPIQLVIDRIKGSKKQKYVVKNGIIVGPRLVGIERCKKYSSAKT
jgi:hypothetical protein